MVGISHVPRHGSCGSEGHRQVSCNSRDQTSAEKALTLAMLMAGNKDESSGAKEKEVSPG